MALLLVAAVPIGIIASVVAWRNYRMASEHALEHARFLREATVARQQTIMGETQRLLEVLAIAPALQPPMNCNEFLQHVLELQPDRFGNIVALDTSGNIRCQAVSGVTERSGTPAEIEVLRRVGRTRHFTLGASVSDPSGRMILPAGVPLLIGERFGGAVVGTLLLDRLAEWLRAVPPGVTAWMIDEGGRLVPIAGAPDSALPSQEDLTAFLKRPSTTFAGTSQGGQPYAWALGTVADGLKLLIGYDRSADMETARLLLMQRLAAIGLLCLTGLAAVAIGANIAVVRPVRQLARAVSRWRGGGPFDPGTLTGLPQELRELSASFAEATRALAEREQQLRMALTQQELLMQEIHHRVKNNLQIIASLMNLQASRIRIPEAKAEFESARDRIRALATLHRHLYGHEELHTINMRSFLTELCGQVLQAMGETGDGRIRLTVDAPELQISSDQAVPMAMIVTEAVSNAARYAFPDGRSGSIQVRLDAEGGRACLVVADDGVGFPDGPADADDPQGGIGIQLIRGFARQLGASLTVQKEAGTRYQVDMILRREPAAPKDVAFG
jgi:two-component sensor histidine kinase